MRAAKRDLNSDSQSISKSQHEDKKKSLEDALAELGKRQPRSDTSGCDEISKILGDESIQYCRSRM